jgi:hypothetical protein
MVDDPVVDALTNQTPRATVSVNGLSRVRMGKLIASLGLAMLLAGCSNTEPADLESLGLAIAADVQAGERFEVTVAKDPEISITGVSAPPGVTAVASEPDDQTLTLTVDVDVETAPGTYNVILRTDRSGTGAELEWPFDVIEANADTSADPAPAAEDIRDEFVAALLAKDATALEALWPESSWDTLGLDVIDWFVPTEPEGTCEPFEDGRTVCFVFEQGVPRVLGLTMDLTSAHGWVITSVTVDSTN